MSISPLQPPLHAGAYGVVDKCLYKPQQRMVAVKKLRLNIVKNKEEVEALKMEIALLKKLQNRWEGGLEGVRPAHTAMRSHTQPSRGAHA